MTFPTTPADPPTVPARAVFAGLPAAPPVRYPVPPPMLHIGDPPAIGMNPSDLAELGAQSAATGIEARALIADLQQLAAQVAVAMAPKILTRVRDVQARRFYEASNRIQSLPQKMGYVNRAQVLAILQDMASRVPTP